MQKEKRLHILFVNQHYGQDAPATGVLLHQLAESLVLHGHHVEVLAAAQDSSGNWIRREETESGVMVTRVRAASIGNKSTLRRLWHYTTYFVLALWAGLRTERPGIVVSMSTPPLLAPLLGTFLARVHKAPFFYNIQDLYPDVAVAAGKIPLLLRRPAFALARSLEARAAGVSTVGTRMQRIVRARSSADVTHLPNWVDVREIRPMRPEESFRSEWGLEGRFVVQYAGNLGLCHDAPLVAEVVELLRNQPVDFLFVGDERMRQTLEDMVPRDCRVHYRPFQPRSEISRVLATADVGWVNLGRGMSRFLAPSKSYGILAAGRPLLAVSDLHDDMYQLVRESRAGVWAPSGDAAPVARLILKLQQDAQSRRDMAAHARRYTEQQWNRTLAVRHWEAWLGREREEVEPAEENRAA